MLREDPSHVFRLIRREERLGRLPVLREAYSSGRLSGSLVDLLLEVVAPATEGVWVAHAEEHT